MKRNRIWIFILGLILLFFLAACGATSDMSERSDMMMQSVEESGWDTATEADEGNSSDISLELGDKIIENANLYYETTHFENALEFVNEEIEKFEGMIEHSVREQKGTSYEYYGEYISMSIRIPNEQLNPFIETLNNFDQLYIQSQEIGQTDVTKTYRDNETRIAVLREEEATLRQMLQEQGSLEEILQIRTRLSEIITELEIYESENQNYDELIEYSTVNLSIQQTDRASNQDLSGFWDRVSNAFGDSFYRFISVMQQFAINLVYLFPYLIIGAIVFGIVFFVWKKFRGKNKNNKL